jgi:DNA-binding transcriptional LysR family regulator
MNINLEYYRVFYNVCKAGSITIAADWLCISQPAVSQAIKQLETELGSRLFLRTSKGVKLTPEGEMLYSYVQKGYDIIINGENKLKKMIDLEMGEVRIGASDMTLRFYLLPFLEQFHELYPNIKVTVTNAPTPETIQFLYQGKIDFGIVSSPVVAKSHVNIKKVKEIEDIFIAGNKFNYLKGKKLDYKELNDLPLIFLGQNTSTRKFLDEYLMKNNIILEPELELATSDIIVQFALRNFGIGCVVSEFAEEVLNSGDVFVLEFKEKLPKRNFCIITDDRNPMSYAGNKLLEMMYNYKL